MPLSRVGPLACLNCWSLWPQTGTAARQGLSFLTIRRFGVPRRAFMAVRAWRLIPYQKANGTAPRRDMLACGGLAGAAPGPSWASYRAG